MRFPQSPVPVCLLAVKAQPFLIEVAKKGDAGKYLLVASCWTCIISFLSSQPPCRCLIYNRGNKGMEMLCQLPMVSLAGGFTSLAWEEDLNLNLSDDYPYYQLGPLSLIGWHVFCTDKLERARPEAAAGLSWLEKAPLGSGYSGRCCLSQYPICLTHHWGLQGSWRWNC